MSATNFAFIHPDRERIAEAAREAEKHALTAPVVCGFYSRMALELAVFWIYENDSALPVLYQPTLNTLMVENDFRAIVPRAIYEGMHYVRKEGNKPVHGVKISKNVSLPILKYLHQILYWLENSYSEVKPAFQHFDESLIPKVGAGAKTKAELDQLHKDLDAVLEESRAEAEKRRALEDENQLLKQQMEEMAQRRADSSPHAVPPQPYSEEETRTLFIDAWLREAGWDPDAPQVREYEVTGMPLADNPSGKGKVDYVLWGNDGKPLAILEAKRASKNLEQGRVQANFYADCLEKRFGHRPLIYLSNGFETSFLEEPFYNSPRPVSGIATRDELAYRMRQRQTRTDLRSQPINPSIVERAYQIEAIRRVAEALVGDDKGRLYGIRRSALLVMATGSGKTRVSAALVDVLSKANWVRRVLFLADRNALVTQAKRNFNTYLPNMSAIDLTEDQPDETTRIVFSTYHTMMNRIDQTRNENVRYFSPGHFDLIIVDEAHRSVYDRYKAIFYYFDAIRIGLTATPRNEYDHDTYELFGCADGDPTAYYELNDAVRQGYLVRPIGKPLDVGFIKQGIHYADLSPAEKHEYESKFRDDDGQWPAKVNASAINQWLFNIPTIDEVITHFMEKGLKVEGGDKIGKTIIFARNHAHALKIKERFEHVFPHLPGDFSQVIDNYEPFAQTLIDNFSVPDKYPQVAISVDMLDTGIDVPEILNLVFFKPVYSSSKYWQMIGRGTRLCKDIFGLGKDKTQFYVFDYCGNFEFFGHNPAGLAMTASKSLSYRLFEARLGLSDSLKDPRFQDEASIALRTDLLDKCHVCIAKLWEERDSFRLRPILRLLDEFKERTSWDNLTDGKIAELVTGAGPYVSIPDDEPAKRFDLLVLELQISIALADGLHMVPCAKISKNVESLLSLGNIPQVKQRFPLIHQVQKMVVEANSENAPGSPSDWETVRIEIRDLQQFLTRDALEPTFTNFKDSFVQLEDEAIVKSNPQMENYRNRVERFIRQNQHHLTIAKLHTNLPVTAADLEELERILFEEVGTATPEDVTRLFGEEKPLGVLIRNVVGMDVQAARAAFAGFIERGNLRPAQLTFLEAIIRHLTQNGVIERSMLAEAPFTDIHDQGVFGVFEDAEVTQLITLIDQVNGNAVA